MPAWLRASQVILVGTGVHLPQHWPYPLKSHSKLFECRRIKDACLREPGFFLKRYDAVLVSLPRSVQRPGVTTSVASFD